MVSGFRVFDFLGVRDVRVVGLGHVNVIVGKNNSGKTTLMMGIRGQPPLNTRPMNTTVDSATSLTETHINEAVEALRSKFSAHHRKLIQNELLARVTERSTWTSSEDADFVGLVLDVISSLKIPLAEQTKTEIEGIARRAFREWMPTAIEPEGIIYVPPKRALEIGGPVQVNQKPQADGRFVLSRMFQNKNQPPGSDDWSAFRALEGAFTEITGGIQFDISLDGQGLHLRFSRNGEDWTLAEASGLGFQDLLIMLFFATSTEHSVLLFEEPEEHLHPALQRRLLAFFRTRKDKQFFLSTHSNVFLDNNFVDRVLYVSYSGGEVRIDDATTRASILDDLGYDVADNLVSDLVVLVEGPTDVPVFEEFLKRLGVLERAVVRFWPLCGDVMKHLDIGVLAESYRMAAVVDSDPGSATIRAAFVHMCEEMGVPVHRLERRSVENYFPISSYREVFGSQVPADLDSIAPMENVEEQLHFRVKHRTRNLARATDWSDVKQTDLGRFITELTQMASQSSI